MESPIKNQEIEGNSQFTITFLDKPKKTTVLFFSHRPRLGWKETG